MWKRNSSWLGAREGAFEWGVVDKAVHRDAHRVDQHGFKLIAPERRTMIAMKFTIELDIGLSFLLQAGSATARRVAKSGLVAVVSG